MKNLSAMLQVPKYWNILSDFDKYHYNCLRMALSSQYGKNQRNKRIENFTEMLEIIKKFCVRGDGDDWRRFLVCGYCCFPEGIAINTRQLKILILKCKSSINGSLHKMGFNPNFGRAEACNSLLNAIPYLRENLNELRQWTVRKLQPHIPSPISPPITEIPNNIADSHESIKFELEDDDKRILPVLDESKSPSEHNDSSNFHQLFPIMLDLDEQNCLIDIDFI